MTSIRLLLTFSSQSVTCNADGTQRSVTFFGSLAGNGELLVTCGRPAFDARHSRWIVTIFDGDEQPLTEFYLECAANQRIKSLVAALYLQPYEYSEAEQPEITTYVWLSPSGFESIWGLVVNAKSNWLKLMLNLTVPFQGSALNYSPGSPSSYDKIWNAEAENPLLFESTELNFVPIDRSNGSAGEVPREGS